MSSLPSGKTQWAKSKSSVFKNWAVYPPVSVTQNSSGRKVKMWETTHFKETDRDVFNLNSGTGETNKQFKKYHNFDIQSKYSHSLNFVVDTQKGTNGQRKLLFFFIPIRLCHSVRGNICSRTRRRR